MTVGPERTGAPCGRQGIPTDRQSGIGPERNGTQKRTNPAIGLASSLHTVARMRDFKGHEASARTQSEQGGARTTPTTPIRIVRGIRKAPRTSRSGATPRPVYERYQQLARDASSGGDRVLAENYQQHAEHYYRVLRGASAPAVLLRHRGARTVEPGLRHRFRRRIRRPGRRLRRRPAGGRPPGAGRPPSAPSRTRISPATAIVTATTTATGIGTAIRTVNSASSVNPANPASRVKTARPAPRARAAVVAKAAANAGSVAARNANRRFDNREEGAEDVAAPRRRRIRPDRCTRRRQPGHGDRLRRSAAEPAAEPVAARPAPSPASHRRRRRVGRGRGPDRSSGFLTRAPAAAAPAASTEGEGRGPVRRRAPRRKTEAAVSED